MSNFKKSIDRIVPAIIKKLGYYLNPLILNFTSEKNNLLIFYFHGIYRNMEDKKLKHTSPQNNITVNQFSDFIEYFLNNKYIFISPADLDAGLSDEQRYIMITFDDGYFNNTWALPVLRKFKVHATFFITTHNLISNQSFWWDVVYKYRTKEGMSLNSIQTEQQYLKDFKHQDINAYLEKNFGDDCFAPWSEVDRPMTREELKVFSSDKYVTIGNHTHNHAILTNYSSEEVQDEFNKSNAILKKIIGVTPKTMALPNGNFDKNILKIAADTGFKYTFTTQDLINHPPLRKDEMIKLNRFMARAIPISNYGSFPRLGYDGNKLYNDLKKKIINFFD